MASNFTLVPSRILLGFIGVAALATLALLCVMPGWPVARAGAMFWCIGAAVHAFKGHRASHAARVDGAAIMVDGTEGRIVDGSFVAPWLTIVRWRPHGSRFTRSLVVMPDAIDAESFRALRVILRWHPAR
jgi:hypothetical protein